MIAVQARPLLSVRYMVDHRRQQHDPDHPYTQCMPAFTGNIYLYDRHKPRQVATDLAGVLRRPPVPGRAVARPMITGFGHSAIMVPRAAQTSRKSDLCVRISLCYQ